jgi:hypothetical protein
MKRILMVSKYFAPENTIAAIRATKIAKSLKLLNKYNINIIASKKEGIEDSLLKRDLVLLNDIYRISYLDLTSMVRSSIYSRIKRLFKKERNTSYAINERTPSRGKTCGKLRHFWKGLINIRYAIIYILRILSNMLYYYKAKRVILKNNLHQAHVVFSTYWPHSSLYIAKYIKNKNNEIFWIADFKDQVFAPSTPFPFRRYARNAAKRICKKADVITAVSQGVLDELFLTDHQKKHAFVIPNGFDRDDLSEIDCCILDSKFVFSYCGNLYRGRRDLSPLFKVISDCISEGLVDRSKLQINYAGKGYDMFKSQASHYHLDDIVVNHGFVDRAKSLSIQKSSHILLLASWNKLGSTGIVTGKLLEYMMMDKPVISMISGELANSAIKEITAKCNLGFCFEEANRDKDEKRLRKYFLFQYNNFIKSGEVIFEPNKNEIERYDYKNITKELLKLIEKEK